MNIEEARDRRRNIILALNGIENDLKTTIPKWLRKNLCARKADLEKELHKLGLGRKGMRRQGLEGVESFFVEVAKSELPKAVYDGMMLRAHDRFLNSIQEENADT